MNEKTVPFFIESDWGHGTEENAIKNVPTEKVADEVKEHLEKDKWVTLEKKDGSTDVLTKKDLPKGDWRGIFGGLANSAPKVSPPKSPSISPVASTTTSATQKFENRFEKVTSVTVTKKVGGG